MGNAIVSWVRIGLAAALGAAAAAQEWRWQVPVLGAVEYRRSWRTQAGAVAKTAAAARALPLRDQPPERCLPRLPPAPWLCQAELRADQKAIATEVRDLRDVARWLACDLGSRGSIRGRFPRVLPFGDLTLGGSWSSPGADGAQTLRATFAARPPAAVAGEPADTAARLRVFCLPDASGTLVMTRRVDAARGLVVAFTAEFDLVVAEGDKQFRRVAVHDAWDLVAVREHADFDFRKRVDHAITAGTGFVREAIEQKKSFLQPGGEDDRSYGSGRLALALLTLLHAHAAKDDPVVVRGFGDLRRRRFVDSYSLAVALMAMAAWYTPPGAAERLRLGQAAPPRPALDDADRKAAAKWLAQLLGNVDPRVDVEQVLRFNYTAGPRYDTSLQQYGLLGLWSAHCCGLDVPAGTFAAAARHLLAVQAPSAGPVPLRLVTHAELREALGGPVRARELRAAARGFAYQDAAEPAFGSMTSAGISGLLLARAGMLAGGGGDRALLARIDDAVQDGFGWLADHFSVRANPGYAERADHHWYYWLYGLERCCELAGIARLQDRDWYHEGALQLLAQQQANGSFRAEHPSSLLLDTTCFAVLFLARASASAAVTGR
jgi:hypothetical protein